MIKSVPLEDEFLVGQGSSQLLFETRFNVKPPMSHVIGEKFDVEIKEYTVFADKVLVKGIVEKSFFYKHPHVGKKADRKKDEGQKEGGKEDKKEEDRGNRKSDVRTFNDFASWISQFKRVQTVSYSSKKETDKNTKTFEAPAEKENDKHYTSGWCSKIDSYDGIIHFYQETMEFAGIVEIPGIMPGDTCHVVLAEVRDYERIIPVETDQDGLIKSGKQMFIVKIALKATRDRKKVSALKNESGIMPTLVNSWEAK